MHQANHFKTSRASTIARRLGGSGIPNSAGWYRCCCPSHADMVPSLSLKDAAHGRMIFKCFAGCAAPLIASKLREVVAGGADPRPGPNSSPPAREPADPLGWAWRILRATVPAAGTVVETYWRFRGIASPLPKTVRYHPGLKHKDSGRRFPAMVAVVTNPAEEMLGIHRTWLAADGAGKAGVIPDKMSLGPIKGGAVHLGEGGSVLLVAEGIETTASASALFGEPAAWATLSTSGMRSVILPPQYTEIIIAADGDANGAGLRAAEVLRQRLLLQHRKVKLVKPKVEGWDFNDVLLGEIGA